MNNQFILGDRLTKIKSIINQHGEENFYIAFSGGKDSTVLSALIDLALPNNKIPRVYSDTGIELNMIRDFVNKKKERDNRIVIIKPQNPVVEVLKENGYPFKSKTHSYFVNIYQKYKTLEGRIGLQHYLGVSNDGVNWNRKCPLKLKYQFTPENTLKISDKCCKIMKEEPLIKWSKENNKNIAIIGIMRDEGGRRLKANCLAFTNGKLSAFQPLTPLTKVWEQWFIDTYNVEICDIYKPPYNFERTGCKGCPFAIHLQKELDTLEKFFPNERKQCEIIWKPVYEEYRRINYRLRGTNND